MYNSKYLLLLIFLYPTFIFAQKEDPLLLKKDTLIYNGQIIPKYIYECDNPSEDCSTINICDSQYIKEILYENGALRKRVFVNSNPAFSSFIGYDREGAIVVFSYNFLYKGNVYCFNLWYNYKLYIQTPSGKMLAEFRYSKGKWRKSYLHGKPVKFAKKLLKIYKSSYKERLYHLENCIWN